MGKRGTKPTPRPLKIVRGDRPARVNHREPAVQVPSGVPKPPPDLSPGAKAIWRAHAADLHSAGLFSTRDPQAFAVFCQAADFRARAGRELTTLTEEGHDTRDGLKKNPAWQVWRDAATMLLKAGAEFGMSPSARQSIVMAEPDDDEVKARLLS